MSRRPSSSQPLGAAALGFVLCAAGVAALAIVPQFVKKPYVLHMGVVLFLAILLFKPAGLLGKTRA